MASMTSFTAQPLPWWISLSQGKSRNQHQSWFMCFTLCSYRMGVSVSYSGRRTVVLAPDRLENRFPGDADTHTKTFFSHYTSLSLLFLCGGGGWRPTRCQGLLGGSLSGKQWSQSSEGEHYLWTKPGETAKLQNKRNTSVLLGWLCAMWLNSESTRATALWYEVISVC